MTRRFPTQPPPPPPGDDASTDRYAVRAEAMRKEARELLELAEYGDACRFAGRIEESEKIFRELLEQAESLDQSQA